VRPMV